MNKIVITVPEEADGTRADKFLAEAIDHLTRSALQKLIFKIRVTLKMQFRRPLQELRNIYTKLMKRTKSEPKALCSLFAETFL